IEREMEEQAGGRSVDVDVELRLGEMRDDGIFEVGAAWLIADVIKIRRRAQRRREDDGAAQVAVVGALLHHVLDDEAVERVRSILHDARRSLEVLEGRFTRADDGEWSGQRRSSGQ